MAANGTRPFSWGGITGQPLSTALPTEHDLKLQNSLIAELRAQNNFASAEDIEMRKQTLGRLQKMVQEFIRQVGKKKGLSQSAIDNAGGKIFTFGSYRLGVFGPGSDIDTLMVAPKHVTRNDFFEYFPDILRKMSPAGAIKELTPVPDAHTPIIKLKYAEVDIDLIFVSLKNESSIPSSLEVKDEKYLRGLDETDLRSINGARVSDEMLGLIPEHKSFRFTLRAIKLWAQRRGIYGNVYGFPGGIAWAILVARICQLYPCATGAVIVGKFFHLMSKWNWPQPVMLKVHQEQGPLNVRVWNPVLYAPDRAHLMPIITPAYPGMCTTHNITPSTKTIIMREIDRANAIANDIYDGKKPWSALFEKHSFFTKDYKHYLSIHTASRSKEAQQIWSGYVQSRVRRLISLIEVSAKGVKLAHPYVKGFDRTHVCRVDDIKAIMMGEMKFQVKDIPESIPAGNIVLYTTTFYLGLEISEVAGELDISNAVHEFCTQSTEWQAFVEDDNDLKVVHTRCYDLPQDVFEPGEMRPTKKKKKAAQLPKSAAPNGAMDGTQDAAVQKRKSSNDPETPNAKRQKPVETVPTKASQVRDLSIHPLTSNTQQSVQQRKTPHRNDQQPNTQQPSVQQQSPQQQQSIQQQSGQQQNRRRILHPRAPRARNQPEVRPIFRPIFGNTIPNIPNRRIPPRFRPAFGTYLHCSHHDHRYRYRN